MTSIQIRNARRSEAQQIFDLSGDVYQGEQVFVPPMSLMQHIQAFPQGIFVAETDGKIVAYAITIRTNHSPEAKALNWLDAIGGLNLRAHEPNGDWLYGVDFGVSPDYRKRGIGSMMYKARFEMVKQLNLRGFYAGGMLAGYHRHADLPIESYAQKVRQGIIKDPTITMQQNRGFSLGPVIKNYAGPSIIDHSAMLISWKNPVYRIDTKPRQQSFLAQLQN